VIRKEEVQPDLGRVTAGIPSLDSPKRFQHDSEIVQKERLKKIDSDQLEKRSLAVENDGSRPIDNKDACRGLTLSADELIKRLTKLNKNLWFQRSETVPSQMMCCLRVSVTEDHPKGLKYIAGFPAEIPISEMGYFCTKERWTHTRFGVLQKVKEPCNGCKDCMFLRQIPGWRTVCERLVANRIITRAQYETTFGAPTMDSRNLFRMRNA